MRGASARFTIRRFVDSDLRVLKELDRQVFSSDDQYADEVYERFGKEELLVFVAVSAVGDVAGYALLDLSGDPIRLRSLAVHPSHRNAGCASTLLRESLAAAGSIDLFVEPENLAAIRLYQRFGFAHVDNTGEIPSRRRMLRCATADGAKPAIRRAQSSEVEAVVRLHHLVRERCMPYLPILHTIEETTAFLSQVVFRECDVLVAERQDAIIGYCAYREGWLDHLYVHPDYQGQGVGSALTHGRWMRRVPCACGSFRRMPAPSASTNG
jgi:ribosomal protein S18 acetylase RimI-like enzyme